MSAADGNILLLLVPEKEQSNKLDLVLAKLNQNVNVKNKELVITNMQKQLEHLFQSENEKLKLRLEKTIGEKEEIIAKTQRELNKYKAERHQIEENNCKLKLELDEQKQKVKQNETCMTDLQKELEKSKSEANKLRMKQQRIRISLTYLKKVLAFAHQIYESKLMKKHEQLIEPPKNREKVPMEFFSGDIIVVALLTTAAPVVGVVL